MFTKLILLALCALALAKPHIPVGPAAAKYPAGVSPHECPNFPFCDNVRLHGGHGAHGAGWNAHGAWNGHNWNGGYGHGHWGGAGAGHGGDKYPAGVNPHTCPNYPFCDVHVGHAAHHGHVAPLHGWNARQYPAGVSPHTCPNFPYCH